MGNEVFRFAAVRPPRPATGSSDDPVRLYSMSGARSRLRVALLNAKQEPDARSRMNQIATEYAASDDYVARLDSLPVALAVLDQWVGGRGGEVTADDFADAVRRIFGQTAPGLITKAVYREARLRVHDSLVAASITNHVVGESRPRLMRAVRLLAVVEAVAEDAGAVRPPRGIDARLAAAVILPHDLFPLPPPDRQRSAGREAAGAPPGRYDAELARTTETIRAAVDELLRAYARGIRTRRAAGAADATDADVEPGRRAFVLTRAEQRGLSAATELVLADNDVDLGRMEIDGVIDLLESRMRLTASRMLGSVRSNTVVNIGSSFVPADLFAPARPGPVTEGEPVPRPCPEPPAPAHGSDAPPVPDGVGVALHAGIADLMIVEQDIQRYEMGEISHIENVLVGETKRHRHRRTQTTEESIFTETERSEQTDRELETTERFELQTESERVINEDSSREIGVTANASYGKVDLTVTTNFSTETSVEESRRAATTFARDVTSRALSRVQERVLQRRFRRTVDEIEEVNTHVLDNSDGDQHVVGVYRWLDKVYRAQVVNYGRRAMFEFVVPEPSAFIRYSLSAQRVEGAPIEKPEPPGYCVNGQFEPLLPDDLTRANYLFWTGKYNVATSCRPRRCTASARRWRHRPTSASTA